MIRILMWTVYFTWAFSIIGWLGYTVYGIMNRSISKLVVLLPVPLISFLTFTYVFVLNRGSHVAQFSESSELWSFWYQAWIPLSSGNLICISIAVISLFIPPYPPKEWKLFMFKVALLFTISISTFHVVSFIPDA